MIAVECTNVEVETDRDVLENGVQPDVAARTTVVHRRRSVMR